MKILILYTELAEYMVSCINEAALSPLIKEIHVVRYPINKEAPFCFTFLEKVTVYDRGEWGNPELIELALKIDPSVVLCSGWIDKTYVNICRRLRKNTTTVLTMDNHWTGSLKQNLLKHLAKFTIHKAFSHAWVPGEPQKEYALKLGFKQNKIKEGFYVTDTRNLTKQYEANKGKIPPVFVCAARYIPAKGLETLWEAFVMLREKDASEWELWCAGQGYGFKDRVEHEGIKHLGFVQPSEMESLMKETGVFVLPSLFEPWGVAVQEFAAAGFPLLLSEKVGSGGSYLRDKENGYLFKAGDVIDLYHKLKLIVQMDESELNKMAALSNKLASKVTKEKWVDTLVFFGTNSTV